MKLVTIEIQDIPPSFQHRYYERAKPKRPHLAPALDRLEPTMLEYEREILPMQEFAYGRHAERYYMRDRDIEAFEQLVNGFVDAGKRQLIDRLWEILLNAEPSQAAERIRGAVEALHAQYR